VYKNYLGKYSEKVVDQLLEELVEELIEAGIGVTIDVNAPHMDGEQLRKIDRIIDLGDVIYRIEVKYGVPGVASTAMKRLASQVRAIATSPRQPKAVKTALIFLKSIDAAELRRLERGLGTGRPDELVRGFTEIMQYFRKIRVDVLAGRS
jgi:hypothetical protein